jgi:hypothetical protein
MGKRLLLLVQEFASDSQAHAIGPFAGERLEENDPVDRVIARGFGCNPPSAVALAASLTEV